MGIDDDNGAGTQAGPDDLPATEGTAQPQPWEIVREFIREIEKPHAALQTHTKQSDDDVWASHNWGDIGKRAVASALRDALSRVVPEIVI